MMATIGRALRYRPLRQGDGTLTQTTAISTQTIVPTLTTRLFVSEIEDFCTGFSTGWRGN